jgi:XTP/dITP diphosphohydrolase
MELCFATNNAHKLIEVRHALGDGIRLLTLADISCTDELPETTGTIPGNSRQKAEYVWNRFGIACFADDSGLEIEALDGAPGVDSAHYSGSRDAGQNMARVLAELSGVTDRRARFVTVITLLLPGPDGQPQAMQFAGELTGEIMDIQKGTHGFGYDPIFRPDGYDRHLAELSMDEKSQISNRARAVAKLVAFLREHASQAPVSQP